jgi:hypothetical protein
LSVIIWFGFQTLFSEVFDVLAGLRHYMINVYQVIISLPEECTFFNPSDLQPNTSYMKLLWCLLQLKGAASKMGCLEFWLKFSFALFHVCEIAQVV